MRKMRSKQFTYITILVFLIVFFYAVVKFDAVSSRLDTGENDEIPHIQDSATTKADTEAEAEETQDQPWRDPMTAPSGAHPIWHLIKTAEKNLAETKSRQSKTLKQAVAEYRRRFGIPPPPNFDKWFEFARRHDVQLIDEFDTIHELLTPFWGLKPATIRARAREALGYANALLGVRIRRGRVAHIEGGGDWMQTATEGMLQSFSEFLPDMDLCFNIHDEPRVMVPHDDMSRLVQRAKTVNMPRANAATAPRNVFSQGDGKRTDERAAFDEVKVTRFNGLSRQPTWTHSRMSCPPSSPARALEEEDRVDERGRYGLGALGFVYNQTAMSDMCGSPSLAGGHGFFDRSNAYSVVHELFPVFSQSKISSYADILFPSPWYWADRVSYNETADPRWEDKADRLYWRGSTTGGFSRYGGWRRQHRQRFVAGINAADQAYILTNNGSSSSDGGAEGASGWTAQPVARADFASLVDVGFSHVGQCERGDCAAQREFFGPLRPFAAQSAAFGARHVLDMDGNAFSGRFYALLRSRSLVYKLAVFREWHAEWLAPWAHYVPLSLQGDEWLEAVRFFGGEKGGKEGEGRGQKGASRAGLGGTREAERLAMQSREWAGKALRKVDLEAWFFRLLLEYGRVIDDNRDNIGFSI